MKKSVTKIVKATVAFAMAIGAGVGAVMSGKGANPVFADTIAFGSPQQYSCVSQTAGESATVVSGSFTIVWAKGSGNNIASNSPWRVYAGNTLTISVSTGYIAKVELLISTTYYGNFGSNYGSLTNASTSGGTTTWTLDQLSNKASSVVLTNNANSQARVSKITMYSLDEANSSVGGETTYSLIYDKNTTDTVTGMPSNQTELAAGAYDLSDATPTRTGYTFGGWAATNESATPITSVTITDDDKTVYAIWTENVVVGSFDLFSGELVEGDYVVCSGSVAMKNATTAAPRLDVSTPTITNNKITNPKASIVWHIAKDGDYWTFYNATIAKYAAFNNSNGKATLINSVTDYARFSVTGSYDFINVGNEGKYLRYNDTYGFASYGSGTGATLTIYKKFVAATGISLDNDELLLGIGSEGNLTATLTPNGASSSITWSSSDEDVATVTQNGVVTGVAAGSATITARVSELIYAECEVTVTAASIPATSITLNKNSGTLVAGQNITLTATVLPANTTDSTTWSTSNNSVATVSDGVVTAVGAGSATITATAGEQHAEFALTVQALNAITTYAGANINAIGKLMYKNGKTAIIDDGTGAFWAYATANVSQEVGSVVRVQGEVVNYNNRGGLEINNATIASADGSVTPSTSVQLNESEALSYISAFNENTSNAVPHRRVSMRTGVVGGEGNFLTWTWPEGTALMETNISKGSMETGKVYDVDGYLINFYKSGNNTYLCICIINAEEPVVAPESISLNKTELKLDVGGSSLVTATINPNGATGDVSWVSSNEGVAEVDNGNVTGISSGRATVTAFIDANGNGVADIGEIKTECAITVYKATGSLEKQTISLDLTSGETHTDGYDLTSYKVAAKSGYYQDNGTKDVDIGYFMLKGTSPLFVVEPTEITFTARLGGGTDKPDLDYDVEVCLVDIDGNEINSTKTVVATGLTVTPNDYTVSIPYSASAYGVKLTHMKENGWNARYYSFDLSYGYADSTATLLGNETGSGVDSVAMKFSAKIAVSKWEALGTVSDYGIMLFKRKASNSAYSDTDTPIRDAYKNCETLSVLHKGSGDISADGDYYIFFAQVNVNNSANYGVVVCAAPFIVVDGVYYFLDEMEYSVNTLAQYHLANGGTSLSEDALNALKGA